MSQALGPSVPYYYSTNFKDNPYSYDYYLANQPQKNPAAVVGAIGLGLGAIQMLSSMSQANSSKKVMKDALNHQIAVDSYNAGMQYDAYQYQQYLNMRQMEREDTAVQRRTEDLVAAGFNPILAAGGNGASSSPLHAGSAPQDPGGRVGAMQAKGQVALQAQQAKMEALVQSLGIARTLAEIRMMDTQKKNIMADTDKKNAEALNLQIINQYEEEYLQGRNQGQRIANEVHAFGLEVSKSKLPYELAGLQLNLSLKEKESVLKDIEIEASKIKVTGLELDNIYKGLQNNKEFKSLTELDQKIQINAIAIAMKKAELDEYEYARSYFHERLAGAPVGYTLPRADHLAYPIIRKAVDSVDNFHFSVPKPGVSFDYGKFKKK